MHIVAPSAAYVIVGYSPSKIQWRQKTFVTIFFIQNLRCWYCLNSIRPSDAYSLLLNWSTLDQASLCCRSARGTQSEMSQRFPQAKGLEYRKVPKQEKVANSTNWPFLIHSFQHCFPKWYAPYAVCRTRLPQEETSPAVQSACACQGSLLCRIPAEQTGLHNSVFTHYWHLGTCPNPFSYATFKALITVQIFRFCEFFWWICLALTTSWLLHCYHDPRCHDGLFMQVCPQYACKTVFNVKFDILMETLEIIKFLARMCARKQQRIMHIWKSYCPVKQMCVCVCLFVCVCVCNDVGCCAKIIHKAPFWAMF